MERQCSFNPTLGQQSCSCVPTPPPGFQRGEVTPSFYVTHVVYAVPGRASSMSYEAGDTVGSTVTTSRSFKSGVQFDLTVRAGFLFAGGNLALSIGHGWGESSSLATDVALTTSAGYRKPGEVDWVDHDDDEIWFLARPSMLLGVRPATACHPDTRVEWGFSPTMQPVPYYVTVGELKGTRVMPESVRRRLDEWEITPAVYPELLGADPFANGTAPNQPMDPTRFELLRTLPYRPHGEGFTPGTQSYAISREEGRTQTGSSELSYKSSIKFGADAGFMGLAQTTLSLGQTLEFTHSTSTRAATKESTRNVLTVGQPSSGYDGPTVLRVYEDKIWHTYVFQLDSF